MSKTTQRKQAAYETGYREALNGIPVRKKKRDFQKQYDEGRMIGKMDRRWNALTPEQRQEENRVANERRREWGPEPVQHEVARPYRGY